MIFGRKSKKTSNSLESFDLNKMFDDYLLGTPVDFDENEALEAFFKRIKHMIELDENKYIHAMKDVNQLGQYMMKMDFVKEMVTILNDQSNSIEMLAATTEEMSTSILGIAELVADNSEAASKSVEITADGNNELNGAINLINDAFEQTDEAKNRVADVNTQVVEIKDMVSIIESVAEQTNLLALNASIEAARAGESGRGFSVVADEIKKLAEHTKDSVQLIQNVVNNLNGTVESSVSAIENATNSFKLGLENINKASVSVNNSKTEVESILSGMESVARQIEEQTAASQETAATVMEINENTKVLHNQTHRTGKAFSDIAHEVNHLRLEMINDANKIDPKDMLDIAITDHLNWRWKIYNMLLGYEKIDEKQVGTHLNCRLGKWIHNEAKNIPEFRASLNKIHKPHEALHKHAHNAVKAYNKGDTIEADKLLENINTISSEIISELNHMMGIDIDNKIDSRIFAWTNKLTVYNHEMDKQHKQLLYLGQKLYDFYAGSDKTKEEFLVIIDELKNYTVYHFEEEEALLVKGNYPNIKEHKAIHKKFVEGVTAIDYDKFDYKSEKALGELITFLSKWVIQHIRNEDYKYSTYLND